MLRSEPVDWWQKDQDEREIILEALWNQLRGLNTTAIEQEKKPLVDFIIDCHPTKDEKSMREVIFNTISNKIELQEFKERLRWLSPLEAKLIDLNNGLNIIDWSEPDQSREVTDNDLFKLDQYLVDAGISAAITIGNINHGFKTVQSHGIPDASAFSIHSVAKIFTGVLVFRMIEEKPNKQDSILSEELINSPIINQLDSEALNYLPPSIRHHLEQNKITLFQLMTHRSGLGDYGYDKGTGQYRDRLERDETVKINEIADFLQFAEPTIYEFGNNYHYSNLGITLVGLAIECAYARYRRDNPQLKMESLNFIRIMKKYILDEAEMTIFEEKAPINARFNVNDQFVKNMVGGPAAGYWTTTEDLAKFGHWLYRKCENPSFKDLLELYGEEFYFRDQNIIQHPGTFPSSSAYLFISLRTGTIVAVLSDQAGVALPLGLNLATGDKIFKKNNNNEPDAKIKLYTNDPGTTLFTPSTAQKELQLLENTPVCVDQFKQKNQW